MLDALKSLFARREAAPTAPDASAVAAAAAALLVRAARIDGDYDVGEAAVIDRALAARFDLTAAEAERVRAGAEAEEAKASDSVSFTWTLKEGLSIEERADLLADLWSVVLADGRRDDAENVLMRKLAGLLYVTDQESARARRRAEEALARGGAG